MSLKNPKKATKFARNEESNSIEEERLAQQERHYSAEEDDAMSEEDEDEQLQSDEEDEDDELEEDEDLSDDEKDFPNRYEKDIEDEKIVMSKRNKLPKSSVDDSFFNLAEMEAFLNAQDKVEESRQRTGRNLGEFDSAQEMDTIIRAYEEENLKSRNWALQGEAIATERNKDELLEQFMDVDYRITAPPTITEEKTTHLEAIIKKRIKEKLFDDVVRKFRDQEALVPLYRNQISIEQTVRKSLAEVYEEKFTDALNEETTSSQIKPELDPQVSAIQKDLDTLFLKLDALSHFQFRPQPIREEIKIVNNMPSLHIEEVGPTATAEPDANLLAPEEIMRRVKSIPKTKDERTETDRKRERRHKKVKQRVLAKIGVLNSDGQSKEEDDSLRKERKRQFKAGGNGRKLDFAGGMQTLVNQSEKKQMKKKKMV